MTMTDPVADFLTRIRNASAIRRDVVEMPISKMRTALAIVLKDEGFITDYALESEPKPGKLTIKLKYDQDGSRVIRAIKRMSKPGCRRYIGVQEIPKVANGQGISILSTTKGIVSGRKAKELGVGGEILATVM
ncbi:MAG: 30S ribosomal protein S8 [Planctomycetes bacterium]|nr:30S ribosomal protein S8 [Planctomycetota bacterium]